MLTFVLAMNNFAVPAILQVKVFPAEMWVRFNTTFDTLGALRLSWPLVVAPLLLLLWFARREFPWPRMEGPVSARLFRQQLGPGWFWLCGTCTIVLCLLAVVLPVFQLGSVQRTWTELPGALAAGQSALWNSFFLAAAAAAAVVVFGLFAGTRRAERFHRPAGLAQIAVSDSSVRSGMSIAKLQPESQAPLGAACRPTPMRGQDMPLLTELENYLAGPRGYKHGAPNGAVPSAQGCEVSGLKAGVRANSNPTLPKTPAAVEPGASPGRSGDFPSHP